MTTDSPGPLSPVVPLSEVDDATRCVATVAARLTAEQAGAPSLLPGWSRGHVLAHLSANAEGLMRLATWALTGTETPMYASPEARDAEIEAGAARSGQEHADHLTRTAAALREQLVALEAAPEALAAVTRAGSGAALPGHLIGHARLRELEIHHVDLGLDHTPSDWSPAFAARTLDQLTPFFRDHRRMPVRRLVAPGGVLADAAHVDAAHLGAAAWEVAEAGPDLLGRPSELLAWLTGRGDGSGLLLDGLPDRAPAAPRWV